MQLLEKIRAWKNKVFKDWKWDLLIGLISAVISLLIVFVFHYFGFKYDLFWLVIIIPGVLFGLMHIANPEVKEYGFWLTIPQYVMFGLFFGLIITICIGLPLLGIVSLLGF